MRFYRSKAGVTHAVERGNRAICGLQTNDTGRFITKVREGGESRKPVADDVECKTCLDRLMEHID